MDEFGSNLNLTRCYARAPRGVRAIGRVPRNTPPNRTVIASLSLEGMGPSMLLVGATDRLAFEAYVEQVLAPTLRPGQIVVMDNLSAHQSSQVQASIAGRDCELWFLPAYSPDLSPIEMAIAKVKAALRHKGAREGEALEQAIMETIPTVSAADAHGFFSACGYLRRHAESQSL